MKNNNRSSIRYKIISDQSFFLTKFNY